MYNRSLESWNPELQDAILTLYKFSFHYLEKFKSPTRSIVEKIINLKIMIFDIITMISEFYEELKNEAYYPSFQLVPRSSHRTLPMPRYDPKREAE